MTQELANPQLCILMRSGVKVWIDTDRAAVIQKGLNNNDLKYIQVDSQTLNKVDIQGIFTPSTLVDFTYEKRGYWKCDFDRWHSKNQDCNCALNRSRLKSVELPPDVPPSPATRFAIEEARNKLANKLSK